MARFWKMERNEAGFVWKKQTEAQLLDHFNKLLATLSIECGTTKAEMFAMAGFSEERDLGEFGVDIYSMYNNMIYFYMVNLFAEASEDITNKVYDYIFLIEPGKKSVPHNNLYNMMLTSMLHQLGDIIKGIVTTRNQNDNETKDSDDLAMMLASISKKAYLNSRQNKL